MSNWDKLNKISLLMNPEEIQALSEPSIMDEYVKQNDPDQWNKIVQARQLKFAMDTAMTPMSGSLKSIAKNLAPEIENLAATKMRKTMYSAGGEKIPARELQLPNLRADQQAATKFSVNNPNKQLAGTSIGQGESVREGDMASAIEAAIRAIQYQRRQPRIKFPD